MMITLRQLILLTLWATSLSAGCSLKKTKTENPTIQPVVVEPEPDDESNNENSNLQTRCYHGDQAACDEIGH